MRPLIRRASGRRATSEFVQGGWTDELVEDEETGEETWVPINESADTWGIKPKPAPPGAVLVTLRPGQRAGLRPVRPEPARVGLPLPRLAPHLQGRPSAPSADLQVLPRGRR